MGAFLEHLLCASLRQESPRSLGVPVRPPEDIALRVPGAGSRVWAGNQQTWRAAVVTASSQHVGAVLSALYRWGNRDPRGQPLPPGLHESWDRAALRPALPEATAPTLHRWALCPRQRWIPAKLSWLPWGGSWGAVSH